MEEILEELKTLRQIVQSLCPEPSESPCQGVTGKGTQCRNRASPDSCYCRMHLGRKAGSTKAAPKKKAQPKLKKIQPEHTCHDGGMCKLCDTHGDVWDPALVDVGFEGCVEIDVME